MRTAGIRRDEGLSNAGTTDDKYSSAAAEPGSGEAAAFSSSEREILKLGED